MIISKRFALVLLVVFAATGVAQAQKSEVRNAYGFLSTGQLDKAKKAIDNASKIPQVANRPRTLLYKSFIYSGIALDSNNKGNVSKELNVALEAIEKAIEINKNGSAIEPKDIADAYNRIYTASYNKGRRAFLDEKFQDVITYFEFATKVRPKDTTLYMGLAIAAQKLYDREKAIAAYEKLLELGERSVPIYRNLGKLYEEVEDDAAALRTFREGRELFPDDNGLVFDELDFYLKQGNPVDALELMEEALALDPGNATLWYSLGVAKLKEGAIGEAEDAFDKAVSLKPDYYHAYYHLGLIYYNSASKIIRTANEKSRFISAREYNSYKTEYLEELNVAEDFFEKAYALNSKDVNLLMPLREVYVRTGQTSRAERIRAEIYLLN